MKLVVIYGAPGVGKRATARALAELTGFRLFHSHLSFDLVKVVFDFPTPPLHRLSETIRLETFEAAAREKVPGLLFTFVYAAPVDDEFIGTVVRVVEPHGGQVLFARLFCDQATLERRVLGEDRCAAHCTDGNSMRRSPLAKAWRSTIPTSKPPTPHAGSPRISR